MRRAVLLLAVLGLTACGGAKQVTEAPPPAKQTFSGGELRPPRAAPPIALHDADGRLVTLKAQRGKYVLVTFLYTHCPDVCPLIAQNLNLALRKIGPGRSKVRVLAVSVDPKGDTAADVKAYAKRMHLLPQFRYLIGTRAQLGKTWVAWRVQAVKSGPDLVDHVAYTALVDPRGKERVLYDSSVKASQVLHDLRILQG